MSVSWRRAGLALLLLAALLAPWPLVRVVYAPAFRALGELALGIVDPLPGPVRARFRAGDDPALADGLAHMDTVVALENPTLGGRGGAFGASSFTHAYFPTCVLLALFLATPRSVPGRRRALWLSLAGLHLFFVLRCAVAAFYAYSKSSVDGRPVLELGTETARALFMGWHFAWNEPLMNWLVPLLLYGVSVFGTRSSGDASPRPARG